MEMADRKIFLWPFLILCFSELYQYLQSTSAVALTALSRAIFVVGEERIRTGRSRPGFSFFLWWPWRLWSNQQPVAAYYWHASPPCKWLITPPVWLQSVHTRPRALGRAKSIKIPSDHLMGDLSYLYWGDFIFNAKNDGGFQMIDCDNKCHSL